jgi:DNA-binding HxlR family transcriptional regulator
MGWLAPSRSPHETPDGPRRGSCRRRTRRPVQCTGIPRILAFPAAVLANESRSITNKDQLGTRMFLIAPFRMRRETMKTTLGSKMMSPIFIGRWTPKVLFSLEAKPYRHGELRRRLQGVSQRMLTRTLWRLESSGLIIRSVTTSKRLAVEYSLTLPGKSIIAPLRGMCRWAKRYRTNVSADVHLAGRV